MTSTKYISDFDKTNVSSIYDKARSLNPETINMWMNVLSNYINPLNINTIIDLGCGTGRFTAALAEYFNCNVIGIDPSHKMSKVASESISSNKVKIINSIAEDMNVDDNSADMIFMSQVYHHIPDKLKLIEECKRVLNIDGYVCIRNSTTDNMDSYLYPQFFPSAMEIDMKRMPLRRDIISSFEENNFSCVFSQPIVQEFAKNHSEYYYKISLRGCSDLTAISDNEFEDGLIRLKEYCNAINSNEPVTEEIDLLIFKKI